MGSQCPLGHITTVKSCRGYVTCSSSIGRGVPRRRNSCPDKSAPGGATWDGIGGEGRRGCEVSFGKEGLETLKGHNF
jgi:hypothetical protein